MTDLKALYLTAEQLEDLDAILNGAIQRYRREIESAHGVADEHARTRFYDHWIECAEGLRTVASAAKGPLPEEPEEIEEE